MTTGGLPPRVDLEAEMALGRVLLALSAVDTPDGKSLVRAAHDCSAGGLIQTLVDSVLRSGVGASIDLTALEGRDGVDDFTALFSESGARAIVAVHEVALPAVVAAAEAEDVPVARIGTTGGELLAITGADALGDGGNGRPLVYLPLRFKEAGRYASGTCSEPAYTPTSIRHKKRLGTGISVSTEA